MRIFKLILLLCFVALLSGCSLTNQVENQGFALAMGLDREADGALRMTIQIPKIAGNASSDDNSGKGGGNYTSLSVSASDYDAALEKMRWAIPRELNLSQLKLIVVSEDLAEEEGFGELIEKLAKTERLYTTSWVAVCDGESREFVEAIKPYIGTRLSTDINASFEHYIERGFIPGSRLAELYFQTNSVYSDPLAAYALLNEDAAQQEEAKPAVALEKPPIAISDGYESDIATRYLGAAAFSDGRLCGVFNGAETVLTNLLRNDLNAFRYESNGQSMELVPTSAIRLSTDLSGFPIRLKVEGALSVSARQQDPDLEQLERDLEEDIKELVQHAQAMKCEPFGFAEKAVWQFATMDDWVNFDWKKHFYSAEIDVDLKFEPSDT